MGIFLMWPPSSPRAAETGPQDRLINSVVIDISTHRGISSAFTSIMIRVSISYDTFYHNALLLNQEQIELKSPFSINMFKIVLHLKLQSEENGHGKLDIHFDDRYYDIFHINKLWLYSTNNFNQYFMSKMAIFKFI